MSVSAAMLKAALASAAFLFLLSGCGTTRDAHTRIAKLAQEHGFSSLTLQGGNIQLAAYERPFHNETDLLTVYIEGDGAPWPSPYQPPRDPTPHTPTALLLAFSDPAATLVYLGRPCQYLSTDALRGCDSRYWTTHRFAPEVIDAYDEALQKLGRRYHYRHLRLIGYSGGGVIAALLATRRDDVEQLVTIAAPLALSAWSEFHHASPLNGSIDPAAYTDKVLAYGVHLVGQKDTVVPSQIVERFVAVHGGRMKIVPGYDHACCWVDDWGVLLRTSLR